MIGTTPFHPRTEAANRTGLWGHWAGYLAAEKYQLSEKAEYFLIRNSAGLFDTSPLYKYRVTGAEAERFLAGVLTRDIRHCHPGHAQYTVWCDDDGHVIEDGIVMRLADDEFFLTSARPNLAYFRGLVGRLEVEVTDVTADQAALAVQGPRSRRLLTKLGDGTAELDYFGVAKSEAAGISVTESRTGFTGDLGYEIWAPADEALALWDAVTEAAEGEGAGPVGQQALLMARIEAGLVLIDVDYRSARFAWTHNERSTPSELGLDWMLRDLGDDRPFVGRRALQLEADRNTTRRRLAGLIVDWEDWDARHVEAGLIPAKDHRPVHQEMMVYSGGDPVGWASSFMYSPILQRHIALARVRPDLAVPGNRVGLEVTIDHAYHTVGAVVTRLPFYAPAHRTGRGDVP
ncbi:MAG TPA: aminomethyltransferase family protein [Acidimicrobiia bacterium]|nr:aminomethyltransferase family protein [Acidimicrobiia bacterium]